MTAPSEPQRRLEELLEDLVMRVGALEEASKAPQLGRASIDGGYMSIRAPDGTTLQTWGMQSDGTSSTKSFNRVPPPVPSTATVTPLPAGLALEWGGQLVGNMPGDFLCVRVHLSIQPDFIVGEGNHVGTLYEAGAVIASDLEYVPHYCKLVAVNLAGAASAPSIQAQGTPKKVVADDVLDGIVGELKLADSAVSAAKLAAAAVTKTKIADGSVETPALAASAVQAEKIAANAVSAGKIAAEAITARELKALGITTDKLAANAVTAAKIAAGSVTADKLTGTLVLGNRIIAGNPNATRVELSASGLLVIKDDEVTFEVDASTGDVTSYGTYYTSRYGERLALNAGGIGSPMMRAYPTRGDYYASLGARTSSTPSGNPVAFWLMEVPYQNQQAVGFMEFVAQSVSTRQNIQSSKLWYRPYVSSTGIVIPGWQAFGQDVALTFFDGNLYVRNNANTAARDIEARTGIFSEIGSSARTGSLRWASDGALMVMNYAGTAGRGVYTTNTSSTYPSWRGWKRDRTPLAERLGRPARELVADLEVGTFRYDPATAPDSVDDFDTEHVGLMLDEVPEFLRTRVPKELGGHDLDRHASWSRDGLLSVALTALQEQDRELVDLREQVAALTDRLEALDGAV